MKLRLVQLTAAVLMMLVIISWLAATDFIPYGPEYIRHFSLLFGPLGLLFVFMQFVLVSRVKIIESGIGLDRLFRWHRIFGRIGLAFLLLHVLLIAYYRLTQFGELFPDIFIFAGVIALIGFMVTASFASMYKRLGLNYETWRNVHLANYLLFPPALIHALYHVEQDRLLFYLLQVLALLFAGVVIYRLVRIAVVRRKPYEVMEVRQEAEDIWSLFFRGRPIDFRPGQFMFVQLLRDGHLSSAHPFTISASPTAEHLSITPKKLGDFTASIKETKVGDKAFIDAPYGVFSFLNYGFGEPVFIAGGIGITPFMSMLRYIYDENPDLKVTLFWANRSERNLCFKGELEKMQEELPCFRAVLVMSDQPDWQGEKGHIKAPMLLNYLETVKDKEFYICGPPAMTRATMEELKQLQVPPAMIHSELFEL